MKNESKYEINEKLKTYTVITHQNLPASLIIGIKIYRMNLSLW